MLSLLPKAAVLNQADLAAVQNPQAVYQALNLHQAGLNLEAIQHQKQCLKAPARVPAPRAQEVLAALVHQNLPQEDLNRDSLENLKLHKAAQAIPQQHQITTQVQLKEAFCQYQYLFHGALPDTTVPPSEASTVVLDIS